MGDGFPIQDTSLPVTSRRMASALVLYARVPRVGQVKTRMTPWLSADEALGLHLALLLDSLALLRAGAVEAGALPVLSFSEAWDPEKTAGHDELAAAARGLVLRPQRDGDLGQRLQDTFTGLLAADHTEVVVIGSDHPGLPPLIIRSAFESLRQGARIALGPAADGGYYLVGARHPLPGIFSGIPWSTGRVMEATLAALDRASVRASLLPPFHDVDVPADLVRLATAPSRPWPGAGTRTAEFVDALRRDGRLPPAPGSA